MNKIIDGIIGFAIGDALGVPVEFRTRSYLKRNPVAAMMGYGSHKVPAGCWSDDTSMTLCLMQSFIDFGYFNMEATMKNFVKWVEEAQFTATNEVFDIGITCSKAIRNFVINSIEPVNCGPKNIRSNGNGSLMRILPVAYYINKENLEAKEVYQLISDISSLTHGHEISILGCYIYINFVNSLLNGNTKQEAYDHLKDCDYSFFNEESLLVYNGILLEDISKRKEQTIKSSGYVVDTLEATLFSLLTTSSYKEAVLKAVNLGDDTDTIGAITGSLAGIEYGYKKIPQEWLDTLIKKDYLVKQCNDFYNVLLKG